MTQQVYDRLSSIPKSEHFHGNKPLRGLVVKLDGVVQKFCTEYCISEGWVSRLMLNADNKSFIDPADNSKLAEEKVSGIVGAFYE